MHFANLCMTDGRQTLVAPNLCLALRASYPVGPHRNTRDVPCRGLGLQGSATRPAVAAAVGTPPSFWSPQILSLLLRPTREERPLFKRTSMSTIVFPHRCGIRNGSAKYALLLHGCLGSGSSPRSTLDPPTGTWIDGTSSGGMGISTEFPVSPPNSDETRLG